MSILSERIKEKRKERGFTQKDLAEKLYISIDTIKSWESGRRRPDYTNMRLLCMVLRTSEEYLCGGKDYINEWLNNYDLEHQEEIKEIINELNLFDYCKSLNCDVLLFNDEEIDDFMQKVNKSIVSIYNKHLNLND